MSEDTAVLDEVHEDTETIPGEGFGDAFSDENEASDGSAGDEGADTDADEDSEEDSSEEDGGEGADADEADGESDGEEADGKEGEKDEEKTADPPEDETAEDAMKRRAQELKEERERQSEGDNKPDEPSEESKAKDQQIADLQAKLAAAEKGDEEPASVVMPETVLEPMAFVEAIEDSEVKERMAGFVTEFPEAAEFMSTVAQQAAARSQPGNGSATAEKIRTLEDQVLGQRIEMAQEKLTRSIENGFTLDGKTYDAVPDIRAMFGSVEMTEWIDKQSQEVQQMSMSFDPRNVLMVANAFTESTGKSKKKRKAKNTGAAKEKAAEADKAARKKKEKYDELHGGTLSGKGAAHDGGDGEENKESFADGFGMKE